MYVRGYSWQNFVSQQETENNHLSISGKLGTELRDGVYAPAGLLRRSAHRDKRSLCALTWEAGTEASHDAGHSLCKRVGNIKIRVRVAPVCTESCHQDTLVMRQRVRRKRPLLRR